MSHTEGKKLLAYELLKISNFIELSALSSCKNCVQRSWLLSTEGLLAAGGIWFGTRVALKGQPKWVITACTTGSLCICLANSVLLHFPSTKPISWGRILTGGILSGAGIGWCLTVAFKEQPKSTIVAYLAGAISICLTNSIMFHVPFYERIQTNKGKNKPEETLTDEVTTQHGLHLKLNPCEREKNIGKESSDTGAGIDEKSSENRENTPCNFEFSVNKGVLQSKHRDVENVSESLESHQQIKMRSNLTLPIELNFPSNSDGTVKCENIISAREHAQRVPVASRFQEMGSKVICSSIASNMSSTEDTAAVMPVDKNNCSRLGDDEASDDEVVVRVKKRIPRVTDAALQITGDLSTDLDESPDEDEETVKYEPLVNQPSESDD